MRLRRTTKENLSRDRKVVGEPWAGVYRGYFSDGKVTQKFIIASEPLLEILPQEPEVLYLCSGNGFLGERLVEDLKRKGLKPKHTIVDASEEQLGQNKNPDTMKICADALGLDLGKKFDVIIMRSSQDYQPTARLQVELLKTVARHLKPEGIFINQAASFSTKEERDLADEIYRSTPEIGDRHFQLETEMAALHEKAGLGKPEIIGEAPALKLTHEDHAARYGIKLEDVRRIQALIKSTKGSGREVRATRAGYEIDCRFPIYASRLKS